MPKHFFSSILTSLACVTVLGASGCDDATDTPTTPEEMATVPGPGCPAPACPGAAPQGYLCEDANHGTTIQLGKYRVVNNLWGISRAGVTGQQCFWSLCGDTGTAIGWGTSWDWTGGSLSQVVSYTAAMRGWHFGSTTADSGLPVQVSANRNVTCTWSFALTRGKGAAYSVDYDLWVGATADATSPTDEIMIWLNYAGQSCISSGQAPQPADIAGTQWNVCQGVNGSFNVYSFMRAGNTNCATFNLLDFFAFLIRQYSFDSSKYLIGIESGVETLTGKGQLDTQHYSCDIQ